jgi:hypothetical protein
LQVAKCLTGPVLRPAVCVQPFDGSWVAIPCYSRVLDGNVLYRGLNFRKTRGAFLQDYLVFTEQRSLTPPNVSRNDGALRSFGKF